MYINWGGRIHIDGRLFINHRRRRYILWLWLRASELIKQPNTSNTG
jgi:hypothetical protein